MRKWLASAVALLCLAGQAQAQTLTAPVVFGYAPSEKGLATVLGRDLHPYTHIMLAFINPDSSGALVSGDHMACMPDETGQAVTTQLFGRSVATARASGARVLGSVAGGILPGCAGDWNALAVPGKRDALVKQLVALVDDFGLDGLDIDIESETLATMIAADSYVPLISALSKEMKKRKKLLTVATGTYGGGMIPLKAIPYFDYIGLMSYDDMTPGYEHSSYQKARIDVDAWLGRGVTKQQLVVGLPFYGYGYGSYQGAYSYSELLAKYGADVANGDLIGQACAGCDYITYNSPATLTRKAAMAKKKGAGVMVWEISQDTPDGALIGAVRAGLAQ